MMRDHTTVSRQAAKPESHGLVERQIGIEDGRVRQAIVTPAGNAPLVQHITQHGRATGFDWTVARAFTADHSVAIFNQLVV